VNRSKEIEINSDIYIDLVNMKMITWIPMMKI
jgi:hypothetical protein